MKLSKVPRETALKAIAVEVDKALKFGPVFHIKHVAIPDSHEGIGCLESHLLGLRKGAHYSLHEWGNHGDIKATSIVKPEEPRGFMTTLKTDSLEENKLRGKESPSIPEEAKTLNYSGDYAKIDWIYPHKSIQGLGFSHRYFYAVEYAVKKVGLPSLHVDATNNGLSFWARKEFGLKIPEENHEFLTSTYQFFKKNLDACIQKASLISPYFKYHDCNELPENIDPNTPYTIPRTYMEFIGAILLPKSQHLHFYKKFLSS